MGDILIRDIPDAVVSAIDARAAKLGISRSEYVRRRLAQDALSAQAAVSASDLRRFGQTFADLANPEVMAEAWK